MTPQAVLRTETTFDVEEEIELHPILEEMPANASDLGNERHGFRIADPKHGKGFLAVGWLQCNCAIDQVTY